MAKLFHQSHSPSEDLARTTLLVTGITIISRLLGFGRDVLIAYTLGGGAQADVFVAVFRLPNFVRRMTSEGCISMPFIPEYYSRLRKKPLPQGEKAAMLFARSAMFWVILLCAPLCALGMLFPEQALLFVAPGFVLKPQEMDAATTLLRLLLPYTLILCTLAIGGSIMQSRGRFLAPVVTPCIPNITVLAVMTIAIMLGDIHLYPQASGETIGEPAYAALLFCQALLFSAILQWLYLGNKMRQEHLRWPGPVSLKTALPFIKKLPFSLCGTASHQINILITGMGASLLANGAIAQFHYADQLISLPLGLFGIAIGIISLPSLTDLAAEGRMLELRATLAQGLGLALFLSLPAAAGLAGIAHPLVEILFERGAFDAEASRGTALALSGATLCLPALAIARPLLAACHAKGYIQLAAICGIISMLFTGVASLTLPPLFAANQLTLLGVGLAVSVGAWVFTSLLWFALTKKKLTPAFGQLRSCLAPFVISLLIFSACRTLIEFLPGHPYLCVGLLVPFCILSYFAFSKLFNCKEARIILSSLKKPASCPTRVD